MPGYKREGSLPPKAFVPPSMHLDREGPTRVRSNAFQNLNTEQPKSSYANKDMEGRVSQIKKPEKAYYGEDNSSLMKPQGSMRIAGSRRNTSGAQKEFMTANNEGMHDQSRHLQEITNAGRLGTKQMRDLTESQRMALGS